MTGVLVGIVLVAGFVFLMKGQTNSESASNNQQISDIQPTSSDQPSAVAGASTSDTSVTGDNPSPTDQPSSSDSTATVKSFTIEGANFKFNPNQITVNKGDTVRITFKNTEGTHNFIIDDFNVKSKLLKTGEEDTVSFVADKTGSFDYYCSVGNHRAMGMQGTLVVQ